MCLWTPQGIWLSIQMTLKIDKIKLFYDLLTINIISSSSNFVDQIKIRLHCSWALVCLNYTWWFYKEKNIHQHYLFLTCACHAGQNERLSPWVAAACEEMHDVRDSSWCSSPKYQIKAVGISSREENDITGGPLLTPSTLLSAPPAPPPVTRTASCRLCQSAALTSLSKQRRGVGRASLAVWVTQPAVSRDSAPRDKRVC